MVTSPAIVNCAVLLFVIVAIAHLSFVEAGDDDDTDYQGLRKQKFRTQKLNVVWDEALKHLKGQKLKSLMTELKAHEKLILSIKKRSLVEEDEEGGSLKSVKSKNLKSIDETVNLEQDLDTILTRYHMDPSIAHSHKLWNYESKSNDLSDNHINSVLETSDRKDQRKFDEPKVEYIFQQASSLAARVFKWYDSESGEGKRQRKEFEEWFLVLERDLVMLESRLKKQRWLEDESNRLISVKDDKKKDKRKDDNHNGGFLNEGDHLELDDIKKRLKSLVHKISKGEKELSERIESRNLHEFPTSHSEGEL